MTLYIKDLFQENVFVGLVEQSAPRTMMVRILRPLFKANDRLRDLCHVKRAQKIYQKFHYVLKYFVYFFEEVIEGRPMQAIKCIIYVCFFAHKIHGVLLV